jgi:hypothetical protein
MKTEDWDTDKNYETMKLLKNDEGKWLIQTDHNWWMSWQNTMNTKK